jgi:hypothetical protein
VVTLRDGGSPLVRPHPAPLLNAEVELWSVPPAAARFPLHPVGVVPLYQRAHGLLEGSGVFSRLDADATARLDSECWRLACEVFTPGEGVRAALERVVQDRAIRPNLMGATGDGDKLRVLEVAYVAAWAVFGAARELAREAT